MLIAARAVVLGCSFLLVEPIQIVERAEFNAERYSRFHAVNSKSC